MPLRSQRVIRRDINRLAQTMQRHADTNPAIATLLPVVREIAEKVNTAWQNYQAATVAGKKKRKERDQTIRRILNWIQRWRPVLILLVEGANENIHKFPASGTTPDQILLVARDMLNLLTHNAAAAGFREQAQADFGITIEQAPKDIQDAVVALRVENNARQAYSKICLRANTVLIRGIEVIRAVFGRTSPEYKQFIGRHSTKGEQASNEEKNTDN
jgi:hypothetical protein